MDPAPGATRWTPAHVAAIEKPSFAPVIGPEIDPRPAPGLDLWDFWPVQDPDGAVARVMGGALWMALSSRAHGDPVIRHAAARIRLFHVARDVWLDLGPLLPDGFGPGSREWSGSAILDGDELSLYYTAAGILGDARGAWRQRVAHARARLAGVRVLHWTEPVILFESDGNIYHPAAQSDGAVGSVKAFRDPGYVRDPVTGSAYILFTASLGRSNSPWNGAIGLARRSTEGWRLSPPIIAADRLNNELERPHALFRDGRWYVFWSTQASVFNPAGPVGPTGLYGMSGPALTGPLKPLNGSGLVLANPPAAPSQAYSWLVLDDLTVVSFVDHPTPTPEGRATFGGRIAPTLRLVLDGETARLC